MAGRYTNLFSLEKNLYLAGSPVVISAGALLKDTATDRVLAQLKFQNIGEKGIKALKVGIFPADTAGRSLGDTVEYQFLDLHASTGRTFGDQQPIYLPDNTARSYTVQVREVVFADSSLWSAPDDLWKPIPSAQTLFEFFQDGELAKQYCLKFGHDCKFVPTAEQDLWFCSCGAINREKEDSCWSCKKKFAELAAGLDIPTLTKEKNARLEQERQREEERQQRLAEEKAAAEEQARIEKEKAREKQKKVRKTAAIVMSVCVVTVALILLTVNVLIPNRKYQEAVALRDSGDYTGAVEIFDTIKDYEDSKEQIRKIWDKMTVRETISAGEDHTVGLQSDGTVVAVGGNGHGQCDVSGWEDIVAISAGGGHTVGLQSDGTVVAVGFNWFGQCDVSDWEDIVAVSAGGFHTVGLKSDGTVVAVGFNNSGQCNVSGWEDIVAVSAGEDHTVGLKSDGTVVAVGRNKLGQCDVSGWEDIVAVSAGGFHTVGLKSDGTVVAVGFNNSGQCNVSGWEDIVAVSAGEDHTVGLKSDGTVVADGSNKLGQCDVSDWEGIVAVSAGGGRTVGLKSDGTVVAVGGKDDGQCNVSGWKDIKVE